MDLPRPLHNCLIAILLFPGVLMQRYENDNLSPPGCGPPEVNANSRVVFREDWMPPGSMVNYTCDPGYHNFGSDIRICRPDGTWSGQPLLCVRKISTGKSMQCVSPMCGGQVGHPAVDNLEHTCVKLPASEASQWKLDLLNDYRGIRQFRFLFHGKDAEMPVVKIFLETKTEATNELLPSECMILQNGLPLDYQEFIIKPNRAVRAGIVNIYFKPRGPNVQDICEAEVYSEDEPSSHQCFDLNVLDGSEQAQHNLKRTVFHQGNCYTFDDSTKVYWKTANLNCDRVNQGTLAHDITPEANGVLVNFLRVNNIAANYWIGGQVQNVPAPGIKGSNWQWRWLTGTEISKVLWNPPQVREDHCLAVNAPGGVWLDFPCHSFTGAVCQTVIKRCGSPRRNARVQIIGAVSTEVGSVLTYRCPPGSQLSGDRSSRCLATGEWSGTPPTCNGYGNHQQQIRNSELPPEAIAGIIAGVIVGLILIAAVLIMIICRRKNSFKKTLHFNKKGESVETLDKEDKEAGSKKSKSKERLNSETRENYQTVNPDDCETQKLETK